MYVTIPFVDPKVLSLDAYTGLKLFTHGNVSTESGFSFLISLDSIRTFEKDVHTDLKAGHATPTYCTEILLLFEGLLESEYTGLVLVLHESEHDMVMKMDKNQ